MYSNTMTAWQTNLQKCQRESKYSWNGSCSTVSIQLGNPASSFVCRCHPTPMEATKAWKPDSSISSWKTAVSCPQWTQIRIQLTSTTSKGRATIVLSNLKLRYCDIPITQYYFPANMDVMKSCQHAGQSALEHTQAHCKKKLHPTPVYTRKSLEDKFKEVLRDPICSYIRSVWAKNKFALLQDLARHALSSPFYCQTTEHRIQDNQKANRQTLSIWMAAILWTLRLI